MKQILIYNSGGGLGDSIQIIPLILSLKNHYRRSKIFYLGAHTNHFEGKLKEYNISYVNASGWASQRKVKIRSIDNKFIHTYDYQTNENRTFRKDRVKDSKSL